MAVEMTEIKKNSDWHYTNLDSPRTVKRNDGTREHLKMTYISNKADVGVGSNLKCLFLSLFITVFSALSAFAAKQKIGDVTWNYYTTDGWWIEETEEWLEGDFAVITGASGAKGKLTLPTTLGGRRVIAISDDAFEENNAITSVVIPEGIVSIGEFAFEECHKIASVSLPEGLVKIGFDAFCGCYNLGDVTIPSTVKEGIAFCFSKKMKNINVSPDNPYFKSVDGVVYSKDGKTLVRYPTGRTGYLRIGDTCWWTSGSDEIPETVESIAEEAFAGSQLKEIVIGGSVTNIGDGAFLEMGNLSYISVAPASVRNEETGDWEENSPYDDLDGVLFTADFKHLICYPAGKKDKKSYTVPSSVTSLGADAFAGARLTGVVLPATIKEIPYEAFEGCMSLTEIVFGLGLETIADHAIYYIPRLNRITLPSSVTSIGSSAFEETGTKKSVFFYPKNAERGEYAFSDCPAKKTAYSSAHIVDFVLNYEGAPDFPYVRNVVNKQPVGLLPTPYREYYGFAGWWTAPQGGTKITSATKITNNTTFYARWMRKVVVDLDVSDSKGKGTITGAGNKTVGQKVTLKATPAKNCIFATWNCDGIYCESENGDDEEFETRLGKLRNPTLSFTMPDASVWLTPMFIRKSEDYKPEIWCGIYDENADQWWKASNVWHVQDGETEWRGIIRIDSTTYSPLSHNKSLPAGMSLVKEYEDWQGGDYKIRITDRSKLPGGIVTVNFTAKNRTGKVGKATFKIILPNKSQAVDDGALVLDTASGVTNYTLTAGLDIDMSDLGIYATNGWRITSVTGIPGLAWNASRQAFAGVPSKAGIYCVTFTVQSGNAKKTATSIFKVDPLPTGIAGTYYGYTGVPDTEGEWDEELEDYVYDPLEFGKKSKLVTLTIASSGKISAKIGSRSLTGNGLTCGYDYDSEWDEGSGDYIDIKTKNGTYWIYAKLTQKKGKKTYYYVLDGTLDPKAKTFDGNYYESFCSGRVCISGWTNADWGILARSRATDADVLAKAKAAGKRGMYVYKDGPTYYLACPECIKMTPGMKKTLFAQANERGLVSLSGTIAGKKVSGSAYLLKEYEGEQEKNYLVAYFSSAGFNIKIVYAIWEDEGTTYTNVDGTAWK